MLYTAKPLERIYADPSVFDSKRKARPTEESEYKETILANGRIVSRREGENYVIESLRSTDMKDYLNEEYYPGKNITR